MKRKAIFFILVCLLPSLLCFGQQKIVIDSIVPIEAKELRCINARVDIPACVNEFYVTIDSLLNIVYKQLMSTLPLEKRAMLKKEELAWLKKRTAFFKAKDKEYEEAVRTAKPGKEIPIYPLTDKSDFEENRLIELIRRLNGFE